jgi:hypothetical protein
MSIPSGCSKAGKAVEIEFIVLKFEATRTADGQIGIDGVF